MKFSRNDPCYCGSGKKFKNCCIDIDREENPLFDNEDFTDNGIPEQFFGISTEAKSNSFHNVNNCENSVCLATLIKEDDIIELKEKYQLSVNIGDWIISSGGCDNIHFDGPFKSMNEAFEFGQNHYGVKRWLSDWQ